jgi:hypothetical protein
MARNFLDGLGEFVDQCRLHANVDRHLRRLALVLGRLGERRGVKRALIVHVFLDAGDALGIEIDIAHDMRAEPPLRIDAAALVHIAHTGNAEIIDGVTLFGRHLPLQPGEALRRRELAAEFLGIEIRHRCGQNSMASSMSMILDGSA